MLFQRYSQRSVLQDFERQHMQLFKLLDLEQPSWQLLEPMDPKHIQMQLTGH